MGKTKEALDKDFNARVQWLRKNPNYCKRGSDPKETVKAMKDAGLLSKSTYWTDINLRRLILAALKGDEIYYETIRKS